MALRLKNGDYVKTVYHDLEEISGAEETAQRIMMRLKARRGGFALLPEYGSRLYTLPGRRPGERLSCARQYVAEALKDENVLLEELAVNEGDGKISVELGLRCGGQQLTLTTEI